MNDVRLISFYLPQFHPIEENDKWWGKGFTEWTNVSAAKPLFPGHYQPHIPADLGFYDLRLPEVRAEQAEMARNYGIEGFCYYYYYFNGKRLLNRPLDEVVASGKPDFPFCICWANENWTRRWDGRDEDVLIRQLHSLDDSRLFIQQLLPVLRDKRYIRVNNKLLLLVYRTELLPDPANTAAIWREVVRKEIGQELYLCAVNFFVKEIDPTLIGFDGTIQFPLAFVPDSYIDKRLIASFTNIDQKDLQENSVINYPTAVHHLVNIPKPAYNFFRGVFPSWDNTPRRKSKGSIFINSSPDFYKLYLKAIIGLTTLEHKGDERLIFINAWNEWAEGAHLEPDKKYGRRFLDATKEALNEKIDLSSLLNEIREKDQETRGFFVSAGLLNDKVETAEEKIAELSQVILDQRNHHESKINELTVRIQEKDDHIAQIGDLLKQKELLLHEKVLQIEEMGKRFRDQGNENIDLTADLKVTQALFESLNNQLAQKENIIETQERLLAEKKAVIEQQLLLLAEKEEISRHQLSLLTEKDELNLRNVAALEEKDHLLLQQGTLIAKKEEIIRLNTATLNEKEKLIQSKETFLREKDSLHSQAKQQLQDTMQRLNVSETLRREREEEARAIRQSLSWKATRPLRWAHSHLFRLIHAFSRRSRTRIVPVKPIIKSYPKPGEKRSGGVPQKNEKPPDKKGDPVRPGLMAEKAALEQSKLFDKEWYLAKYPDVRKSGTDPCTHFLQHGFRESRQPNPLFDIVWYQKKYESAIEPGSNPLIHYLRNGKNGLFDPNPFFDSQWYLSQYPDVARSRANPLSHYLCHGIREKRSLLKSDKSQQLSVKKIRSVAVLCHVYYPELWDELATRIMNISLPCELFVSIPENVADELKSLILEDFPSANIRVVENVGGDIYPFILFLNDIQLKGHEVFCKLHTKKGRTDYGTIWREVLLSGVLGSEPLVNTLLNAFDSDPDLCLAGAASLYKSVKALEYGNLDYLAKIHETVYPGVAIPDDWGFFAGTMFWGRTNAFLPLAQVIKENFQFEKEDLKTDGQLAHAIERITGAIVLHRGGKIGLVENELGLTRSRKLTIVRAPGYPSVDSVEKSMNAFRIMHHFAYRLPQEQGPDDNYTEFQQSIGDHTESSSGNVIRKCYPFFGKSENEKVHAVYDLKGKADRHNGKPHLLVCGHSAGNVLAGGEISFLDIVTGLFNNGFNITLVLPEYNDVYVDKLIGKTQRIYIVPYVFWGLGKINQIIIRKLIKIIDLDNIDAVYVNTIMIREPFRAARIRGIPAINHVRELITGDEVLTEQIHTTKEEIQEEVLSRTDFIIANSKATAAFYEKKGRTFIVPNTIDVRQYDIPNQPVSDRITIALISSNIPKKGIYEFVEVAKLCLHRIPHARFLLIGNETNAVKQLFSDPKNQPPSNLFSTGYAEQPLDAVAQANIVVNLSLFTESFGRTVLEAMAARRPVVAYDNGAISELIEEGKSGFLVPFRDVFAAAEKIIHLCTHPDLILTMGEYGRKLAVEKYSLSVYDHILGNTMTKILSQWPQIKSVGEKRATRSDAGVRISVVIPNYNYSHYLGERIRSIVTQTLPPAEIIFLDDASSDDSVKVVRPLLEASGIPFKIEVNERNQGVYRQWIKGIEMATGEYLWIAEADDTCEQDFLEKLSRRMIDDGSVIAYCQSRRIGDQGQLLAPHNLHHTDDLSRERWLHDYTETGLREVTDYLLYRNSIPNASACLFKKSALKDIPEDFSGFRFVGDWLLYAWLLSKGDVSYLAESMNHFRRHSESVTRIQGKSEDYLEELVRIKRYIVHNFPVHKKQLRTMISFLNKDHVIEGWKVNADHPSVKSLMKEAESLASGRRRFVFLTTNNGSHNGGSEQLWIQTALDSRKAGHDVMAIIKKWEPAPWFFDAFRKSGIKLLFKEGLDFGEVVRFDPDLMIISTGDQDEGIEWYDLCRERKIPYAIVNQLTKEPEYWPIRPEKTQPVLQGYLGAEITFFTSKNNHKVMEKRLGHAIPNAGFFYQPFFVDRSVELPYPSTDAGLKLALPSRLLTIHKGQHLALEVINQKKWRDRPIILNFYGVGPDEKKLKEMAAKYGLSNVHFHEPRWKLPDPDLFDIWRENHGLLMPSFMEGMPLVLLNAMVCGRVPIVTDIGGHREVIEDNVNGFIAARPSVEALDEAMERAYRQKDRWEEIGQKARQTMLAYLPEDPVGHFTTQLVNHARKP